MAAIFHEEIRQIKRNTKTSVKEMTESIDSDV